MPGASRVGVDTAGGIISGPGSSSVKVNGATVSVLGDSVVNHGTSPHNAATMVAGSSSVFAGGVSIVRSGDAASCGHIATGSTNVLVG